MRARLLRQCHSSSVASSPVPRGHIIRRAGRVGRRPLRHLQGARGLLVLPHRVALRHGASVFSAYSGAFPVRARSASGVGSLSALIDRRRRHRFPIARSDRRGSPRPCSRSMPRACSSRRPFSPRTSIGAGATARVRPPTLTTLPSATDPRSQFTPPTAPQDRRRPSNQRLQQTGMRLLLGAAAPASARLQLNRIR